MKFFAVGYLQTVLYCVYIRISANAERSRGDSRIGNRDMTNATENANGRARVVMAGALQDQIDQLNERAEHYLAEACEERAKAAAAAHGTWEWEQAKRKEHWYFGRRDGLLVAADQLKELLAVSIKAAQREAETETRSLSPSARQSIVREIMEHEEQCEFPCSEEGLNRIEAKLFNATDDYLIAEYKNYFPGSAVPGVAS